MATVLVLEAERDLRDAICVTLEDTEHHVLVCTTSDGVRTLLASYPDPLIILLNGNARPLRDAVLAQFFSDPALGRRHALILYLTDAGVHIPREIQHAPFALTIQPLDLDALPDLVRETARQQQPKPRILPHRATKKAPAPATSGKHRRHDEA